MKEEGKVINASLDDLDIKKIKKEEVEEEDYWLKEWVEEPENIKQEAKVLPDHFVNVNTAGRNRSSSENSLCGLDETGQTELQSSQKCSKNPLTNSVNTID